MPDTEPTLAAVLPVFPLLAAAVMGLGALAIVALSLHLRRHERGRRMATATRWYRAQPRASRQRQRPPSSRRRRGGEWDEPAICTVRARPLRPEHHRKRQPG
jgi:hypothetical protein